MTTEKQGIPGKLKEAEEARGELSDALSDAGVRLPSLSLDAVSCTGPGPGALIDLGRCNVETARALATALRHSNCPQKTTR
ncbi:hypothetical protein [Streptomyces sp. WMMB 322]|uniref:hypothetical protein n=1 Tax=Streptomyces sp. WMMB 322 TaxID=1286821 RepID=UPI0006E3194C|nr:hypothetical protein [Streptomyces sp. WMMB 322]SCK50774.1 hypothetical protein H180DRAFT_04578 [Streptomyces sp. WMMB 322]